MDWSFFGFLLLTLPAFRFWLYLLRADVIGVVFSMTGVALYVFDEKRWYRGVPFFALAMFCKYTLIAAPVAVFLHLTLNRKVRQGVGFAMGLGLVATAAFVFLQIKTDGWFAFHMFSTHPDRYSLRQFFALAALVWVSAPVVTALAVWWVAQDFRGRSWGFRAPLLRSKLHYCSHRWEAWIDDEPFHRVDGRMLLMCRPRLFVAAVEVFFKIRTTDGSAERFDLGWGDRTESSQLAAVARVG